MIAFLILSLAMNIFLIIRINNGPKYDYADLERSNKVKDDQYRQLIFWYLKDKHGSDSIGLAREQAAIYEMGRERKILND